MKWLIIISLVAAIYGCREFKPDPIQEFIPGTYIRFSTHEFGNEYDTIIIKRQTGNQYSIVRRLKYERTGETPEYKITVTAGIYKDENKMMEDMNSGDLLSFDKKQKTLFIAGTKYKKL